MLPCPPVCRHRRPSPPIAANPPTIRRRRAHPAVRRGAVRGAAGRAVDTALIACFAIPAEENQPFGWPDISFVMF
ncbi:hypothetical protein [Rugamonas rubra]|uniref:hypothetical protein n=1 Tax=Rugamonas rubra TaxID=758825 RepID=UPI0011135F33|nr:hypothetical protein [Rugamonas rubra]